MLSWEYPPLVVGGLGRHVAALSRTLAAQGHDVHVVTRGNPDLPAEEMIEGVHVIRVDEAPPVIRLEDDLVPWVLAFNHRLLPAAARIIAAHDVDIIHAHDWLVAYAAAGLRDAFHVPVVGTIHATEYGRHQGWLPGPMNKYIHQVEWWLTYESRRVITCSHYMLEQVTRIFQLPPDKGVVVPNAVARRDFAIPQSEAEAFRAGATPDGERMVIFAGRLEYEKGVQTVLHALWRVREVVGPVVFYVAGVGTYSEELHRMVDELDLADVVRFTGFLEDHDLRLHYAAADVAVAPSIYEPFGLVAVEAMACSTPVVVGDTGGLREIVADGHGLVFEPQDAEELSARLIEVLTDPTLADELVAKGLARVEADYDWGIVAEATHGVYTRAILEEAQLGHDDSRPSLRDLLTAEPILELE